MALCFFAQKAAYFHAQIQNILNSLVPKQKFLGAQMDLTLTPNVHGGLPDNEPVPITPLVPELPG
jgi:hypothetical protein